MDITVKKVTTRDYLTKSNLPASDYVINPYVGCPHACKYCYASFMKRFTGHTGEWGSFVDIKECEKGISISKIKGKSVFLSSVTDCYNPFEEQYGVTRKIYIQKDHTYWKELEQRMVEYCEAWNIKYKNYFYHEKLVTEKRNYKLQERTL